jgi:hypothetical protein
VNDGAKTVDLYDELTTKVSQLRGQIALLTLIDPADLGNVPEGALAQSAWSMDEQLEAINTLASIIYERHGRAAWEEPPLVAVGHRQLEQEEDSEGCLSHDESTRLHMKEAISQLNDTVVLLETFVKIHLDGDAS